MSLLRTLAFGSLAPGRWGAGWFPDPGGAGLLVLGTDQGAEALVVRLEPEDGEATWRLHGQGVELTVSPAGQAARLLAEDDKERGFEQLCRVTGTSAGRGGPEELEAPGRRGERRLEEPLERLESVRHVSAWFTATGASRADGDTTGAGPAPGGAEAQAEAVSVLALRPRKQRGHEHDALSAAVLDRESATPIAEPRLSTTYRRDGRPARMNLELWPVDEEQPARRFAGEATGSGLQTRQGVWEVWVELLRCHGRGAEGPGVYLLARPG